MTRRRSPDKAATADLRVTFDKAVSSAEQALAADRITRRVPPGGAHSAAIAPPFVSAPRPAMLIVAWIIVCWVKPRWAVLPGTEHIAIPNPYVHHFKEFLMGTAGLVIVALAIAALLSIQF